MASKVKKSEKVKEIHLPTTIPGPRGEKWKAIDLPGNAWQTMLFKGKTYDAKAHLPFLKNDFDKDLGQDLGLTGRGRILDNPANHIITTGIRHLSTGKASLEQCLSWVPRVGNYEKDLVLHSESIDDLREGAWHELEDLYSMHRYVEYTGDAEKLKRESHSGTLWNTYMYTKTPKKDEDWEDMPTAQLESMEQEHYFECRFAGAMLTALGERFPKDSSMQDAMILLDRLINHPNNLIFAPASLNLAKKNYFDGKPCPNNNEYKALMRYMDNCAYHFRGLITRLAKNCIPHYQPNSIILGMLKVIYDSPFCNGRWETLPDNGQSRFQWTFYKSSRPLLYKGAKEEGTTEISGWQYISLPSPLLQPISTGPIAPQTQSDETEEGEGEEVPFDYESGAESESSQSIASRSTESLTLVPLKSNPTTTPPAPTKTAPTPTKTTQTTPQRIPFGYPVFTPMGMKIYGVEPIRIKRKSTKQEVGGKEGSDKNRMLGKGRGDRPVGGDKGDKEVLGV